MDPDPVGSDFFAGSGNNHSGSGSGRPGSEMNLNKKFSHKIHNFSTKCTIFKKSFQKISLKSFKLQNTVPYLVCNLKTLHNVVISEIKCEFTALLSGTGQNGLKVETV